VEDQARISREIKPMIPPEQAVLFVEEVRKRLTLVSLNEDEYFETMQKDSRAAQARVVSSIIEKAGALSRACMRYNPLALR
jgi:hypothetical protein